MNQGKMEINVQIFSGGFDRQQVSFTEVKAKLDWILAHLKVRRVIVGWSREKLFYQQMREYLRDKGISLVLWLPVFSELAYFKPFQPVLDYLGREIANKELQEGESFEFYCPVNKGNRQNIVDIYEQEFSQLPIDGVFLDKIRYPSFSNGVNAVFSCFCEDCCRRMAELGINVAALKETIAVMELDPERGNARHTEGLSDYAGFKYAMENPLLESFFDFKSRSITEAVGCLSRYLRDKGLEVGLDTFAPHLGFFVGQDISSLLSCSDFVKPMFYRRTLAPAGMPYETEGMTGVFHFTGSDSLYEQTMAEAAKGKAFPENFVVQELQALQQLQDFHKIFAGFEVNRKKGIADVFPDYIAESVAIFSRNRLRGISLSWDMMDAPAENLKAVEAQLLSLGR